MANIKTYLSLVVYLICTSSVFCNEDLIAYFKERSVLSKEGHVSYKEEKWVLDVNEKILQFDEDTIFENEVLNFDLENNKFSDLDTTIIFNENGFKKIYELPSSEIAPARLEKYGFTKDKVTIRLSNILGTSSRYHELTNTVRINPEAQLSLPITELFDIDPIIAFFDQVLVKIPERTVKFYEENNKTKLKTTYKKKNEGLMAFEDGKLTSYCSKIHNDDGVVLAGVFSYYTKYMKVGKYYVPSEVWTINTRSNNKSVLLTKLTVLKWDANKIDDDLLAIEVPKDAKIR